MTEGIIRADSTRVMSIMFLNLGHVPMSPRARTSVLDLWYGR